MKDEILAEAAALVIYLFSEFIHNILHKLITYDSKNYCSVESHILNYEDCSKILKKLGFYLSNQTIIIILFQSQ